MPPAILALLRAMGARGAKAALGRAAAPGGVSGAIRGLIGQRRAAQAAARGAARRPVPQPPVPQASGAATKPTVNYSQMMTQMGNPQAYQQAVTPPPAPPPPRTFRATASKLASTVTDALGLKDAFGGLQKMLKGDVVGGMQDLAKGITKAKLAFVGVPLALERFTRSLVESRREQAQYSGAIATAYAKLDAQQFRRDIQTASGTQGTTVALTESFNELANATRPMIQDVMSGANILGIIAAKVGTLVGSFYSVFRTVNLYGPLLDAIERNTRKTSGRDMTLAKGFLDQLQRGDHAGGGARPPLPPVR